MSGATAWCIRSTPKAAHRTPLPPNPKQTITTPPTWCQVSPEQAAAKGGGIGLGCIVTGCTQQVLSNLLLRYLHRQQTEQLHHPSKPSAPPPTHTHLVSGVS